MSYLEFAGIKNSDDIIIDKRKIDYYKNPAKFSKNPPIYNILLKLEFETAIRDYLRNKDKEGSF